MGKSRKFFWDFAIRDSVSIQMDDPLGVDDFQTEIELPELKRRVSGFVSGSVGNGKCHCR
jgi:hypothetical protein